MGCKTKDFRLADNSIFSVCVVCWSGLRSSWRVVEIAKRPAMKAAISLLRAPVSEYESIRLIRKPMPVDNCYMPENYIISRKLRERYGIHN